MKVRENSEKEKQVGAGRKKNLMILILGADVAASVTSGNRFALFHLCH